MLICRQIVASLPLGQILPLKDDDATQEKMIELESEYGGRIIVLNSFPSMIYLHTGKDSDPRFRRCRLLMGKSKEDGNTEIINTEYYPLRAVLTFGFFDFNFPVRDRIKAIKELISCYDNKNHVNKNIYVIKDTKEFSYSRFAGNCEILLKKQGSNIQDGMLVFNAPFYEYGLLIVRSTSLAKKFYDDVSSNTKDKANVMSEKETKQLLKTLLAYLEANDTSTGPKINDFIEFILEFERSEEQGSSMFELMLQTLPEHLLSSTWKTKKREMGLTK